MDYEQKYKEALEKARKKIENSRNIDDELLKRKINDKKHIELPSYNKIFLNEALEFTDMVFDNNVDKIYFLKQYLKNNKEIQYNPNNTKMVKSKKYSFIK